MDALSKDLLSLFTTWLDVQSLLALRASCRRWRVVVDGCSRWCGLVGSWWRLREEERQMGWLGVMGAMQRERETLKNVRGVVNGSWNPTFREWATGVGDGYEALVVGNKILFTGLLGWELYDYDHGTLLKAILTKW